MVNFPDLRFDANYVGIGPLVPKHCRKEYIKDPENYGKVRDYMINLYFAKPDYEEPNRKMMYMTYLGAKVGSFYAMCEVIAKDIYVRRTALEVFAKRFVLITGSFASYTAVTSTVANIRHKDDFINHAFGGASLGIIAGYYLKCSGKGAAIGALAAAAGALTKKWHQSGFYFFHPQQRMMAEPNFADGGEFFDWRFWRIPPYKEESQRRQHYLFSE